MEIDINDILARYGREVATLTQRAIAAEAQVEALAAKLAELTAEQPGEGAEA